MLSPLEILVVNDDGFDSKGIRSLAKMMSSFGHVTVVAPEFPQSATSTGITMGRILTLKKQYKDESESWYSLDATPTSCVKFAFSDLHEGRRPDVVVSGVNHGSNAATAANYSGTLGAVEEAALLGIPAIGVSVNTYDHDADFSQVEAIFPDLFQKLLAVSSEGEGVFFNVNFPDPALGAVKGIRVARRGFGHWVKEYESVNPDECPGIELNDGERLLRIAGNFVCDSPEDDIAADINLLDEGYATIVAHNVDNSDERMHSILRKKGFDEDFTN